jgi:hypothetical protein
VWPSVFLWPVVFAASATVAGELETIVVTGTRQETPLLETPVATEVIDGERLRAIGAENAAEALATHPGVQLERSFNGTTVQLQGLSASAVLVLIDGQRQTGNGRRGHRSLPDRRRTHRTHRDRQRRGLGPLRRRRGGRGDQRDHQGGPSEVWRPEATWSWGAGSTAISPARLGWAATWATYASPRAGTEAAPTISTRMNGDQRQRLR